MASKERPPFGGEGAPQGGQLIDARALFRARGEARREVVQAVERVHSGPSIANFIKLVWTFYPEERVPENCEGSGPRLAKALGRALTRAGLSPHLPLLDLLKYLTNPSGELVRLNEFFAHHPDHIYLFLDVLNSGKDDEGNGLVRRTSAGRYFWRMPNGPQYALTVFEPAFSARR